MVEIRPADSNRIAQVAEVIGRAFVTEPMMTWPLGGRPEDLEERCIRANALFLEPLMERGIVWETADGHGALVLVPPEQAGAWDDANLQVEASTTDETDDGGRRYERFWEWVAAKIPQESLWHLDSVAVEPGLAGSWDRFCPRRLRARASPRKWGRRRSRDGHAAQRSALRAPGIRGRREADSPDGGPHIWFMRLNP